MLHFLMVKRHHQIDFASGALVFPGGKIHQGDDDAAWAEHVVGWERFERVQRALRMRFWCLFLILRKFNHKARRFQAA